MEILKTIEELERWTAARGKPTVLVPTMGALHAGHGALVMRGAGVSRERGLGGCVVSVFVNPTQFNDPRDLERYPRTLEADAAICDAAGANAVFAPSVEAVYPRGGVVSVPSLPAVATRPGLEDAFRPGHFAGVCQVVGRLFELVRPEAAVFGEKDWQQLRVVSAMEASRGRAGVEIIPHPTLRDADGLAMSSRNRFLTSEERRAALTIPRALARAAGIRDVATAERAMAEELAGLRVEYAAVRDAETLEAVIAGRPGRALIAAWSGKTRLIDNASWGV
ncbi:MAG: pantoate--beta-alanine ligase [Phycisphaerales bacterium]